ncbi:MAG: hypothetical protein C0505_15640 [Leptothrix sp. (in: Bacteria)]|nr:hypothetical protein [Leptothrix sp. (in: b-proteobacteria)]
MKPNPIHRLPAPLEAAIQRLKMAARQAAERTIESLGLAALAAHHAYQRDGLLEAQFELNRKSAIFALTFNDALDERVLRELGPQGVGPGDAPVTPLGLAPAASDWGSLSLVEDKEVEAQISAERFGMEVTHACEWELRELEGYVGALLGDAGGERDRNPLRPDIVGHAVMRGIDALSERPEVRKVLSGEFSRTLNAVLRQTYADILADLRHAGVQPLGLMVRHRGARGATSVSGSEGDAGTPAGGLAAAEVPVNERSGGLRTGFGPGNAARRGGPPGFGQPTQAGAHSGRGGMSGPYGTPLGQVDPALMSLIRRLAFDDGGVRTGGDGGAYTSAYASAHGDDGSATGPLPANLIHAHREELRRASRGSLDHMVIDVIGFLFDQILADSKVPPQMARQIARLQLPVLRAALGDPSFFSSRKHPVRRFVNRIASLGSAFEDFGDAAAQAFLGKVKALVHEVVEGDFDQIEVYEQKLAALEAFTVEAAGSETPDQGATTALLAEMEDQQRLRQLYAQRVEGDLKGVQAPAFLRDFIGQVWSQVLLRAALTDGPEGALVQRMRTAGRELYLSVQPKATPSLRKAFLTQLPKLMQELTEGMNLIGWAEADRRRFFGQLMPAHAEALKQTGGSQLDINLMARQVEGALRKPLPSRDELRAAKLPVLTEELAAQVFSAEQAQRVGLVQESAVNWSGEVDIDITARAEAEEAAVPPPQLPGLPVLTEPAEPTEGRALAEHLEVGFAYQMHLDDRWQKVRLTHISPARSFYLFTHGGRHRKTVSLTQRMLTRLCETGRLRAYESAYLIERATARARRQLAALAGTATRH